MKMKPEHYEAMKRCIDEKLRIHPDWQAAYKEKGLSETRFRWDVLHSTGWLINNGRVVYEYLNDDNIDTALRNAIP